MEASKLLYDDRPLVVNPILASLIGLNETIILQQIHYWVGINTKAKKNWRDGYYWTYNSYPEWRKQFPFWSTRTIQRLIRLLEKSGLLISSNFNRLGIDRTKWYRIDYDKLSLWKTTKFPEDDDKLMQPLPETTSETTPKTNKDKGTSPSPQKGDIVIFGKENDIKNISYFAEVIKGIFDYYGYPDKTNVDPIPNYGKEGKAIKRMLERGFEPEQILECWREKVKKAGMFKSMVYVNEDIDVGGDGHNKHGDNRGYYIHKLYKRFFEEKGRYPDGGEGQSITDYVVRSISDGKSSEDILSLTI